VAADIPDGAGREATSLLYAPLPLVGGYLGWRIRFRGCRNPGIRAIRTESNPSPNRPNTRSSLNAHTLKIIPPCGAQQITPNPTKSDPLPNGPNQRIANPGLLSMTLLRECWHVIS